MNPVELAALDALDLLVVVDNESDTLHPADAAAGFGIPLQNISILHFAHRELDIKRR